MMEGMSANPPRYLELELFGSIQRVPAEELEPETSPHTGRALRRARISFRVAEHRSDEVATAFAKTDDVPLRGADGSLWSVASSSYSYIEGKQVRRHEAELREVEELNVDRLELLGLSLTPTRYKEENRGYLVITARIDRLGPEEDAALEREIRKKRDGDDVYFDVLRVGISDTPLRMRFGRCLWQKAGEGRAHLVRLVSEERDDRQPFLLSGPEQTNLERKAATAEETIEALLEELQSAGVLSDTSYTKIRRQAEGAWEKRMRDFDRAHDLDLYF
jgi:hypothetical protein